MLRCALAIVLVGACFTSSTTPPPTTPATPTAPAAAHGPPMTDLEPDLERDPGGAPTPALDAALTAYRAKQYPAAARGCGETHADPATKQRAQLCLAKSLFRLGLYAPAAEVLDEIARTGPAHRDYALALVWLVATMRAVPGATFVVDAIATYPATVIDDPQYARARGDLAYAFGKHAYDHANFELAIERFANITDTNAYYAKARSLEGAARVRTYDAHAAGEAFGKLLAFARRIDDEQLATAAITQLARLQFSTGAYAKAIRAYEQIASDDVRLELAWSYYHLKNRAKVHATLAPLIKSGKPRFSEAWALAAITHFEACAHDDAVATVEAHERRFDPIRAELEKLLQIEDHVDLLADVRPLFGTKVILDGALERAVAWVDELLRERLVFEQLEPGWGAASVGLVTADSLAMQMAIALADAGRVARNQLERTLREIQAHRRDQMKVKFEVLATKRDALANGTPCTPK